MPNSVHVVPVIKSYGFLGLGRPPINLFANLQAVRDILVLELQFLYSFYSLFLSTSWYFIHCSNLNSASLFFLYHYAFSKWFLFVTHDLKLYIISPFVCFFICFCSILMWYLLIFFSCCCYYHCDNCNWYYHYYQPNLVNSQPNLLINLFIINLIYLLLVYFPVFYITWIFSCILHFRVTLLGAFCFTSVYGGIHIFNLSLSFLFLFLI